MDRSELDTDTLGARDTVIEREEELELRDSTHSFPASPFSLNTRQPELYQSGGTLRTKPDQRDRGAGY